MFAVSLKSKRQQASMWSHKESFREISLPACNKKGKWLNSGIVSNDNNNNNSTSNVGNSDHENNNSNSNADNNEHEDNNNVI